MKGYEHVLSIDFQYTHLLIAWFTCLASQLKTCGQIRALANPAHGVQLNLAYASFKLTFLFSNFKKYLDKLDITKCTLTVLKNTPKLIMYGADNICNSEITVGS
jgi:hypothetical protein